VVAVEEEHESVEVWEGPRIILVDDSEHARPAEDTELVRSTGPVKPLIGEIVIVDAALVSTFAMRVVGLAEIVKSCAQLQPKVTVAV